MANWYVYMIRCRSGALYTGITTDVARRFDEHQASGPRAAGYLRGRGPLQLVFKADVSDRVVALRLEYKIKRLTRAQKKILIQCPESLWEIVGGAKRTFPVIPGIILLSITQKLGERTINKQNHSLTVDFIP